MLSHTKVFCWGTRGWRATQTTTCFNTVLANIARQGGAGAGGGHIYSNSTRASFRITDPAGGFITVSNSGF